MIQLRPSSFRRDTNLGGGMKVRFGLMKPFVGLALDLAR